MGSRGISAAQGAVFVVGVYEGVVPLVARAVGWDPVLAFPLLLPAPYWWIVSVGVIVGAVLGLELLDQRKPSE
jgi:hypothetical protein